MDNNIIESCRSYDLFDISTNEFSTELRLTVKGVRDFVLVLDNGCTVKEAAFKLRQLAASIERHDR